MADPGIVQTVSERIQNSDAPSMALTSTALSGNILISIITNSQASRTFTAPSGWTLELQQGNGNGQIQCAMAYKISDGTESTVDWTGNFSAGDDFEVCVEW